MDAVVQVSDKTRLDASLSFVAKGSSDITLVEIKPSDTDSFIDITGDDGTAENWYLDWAYATAGEQTVSLRITTDGSPVTITKTITVLTEAEDGLLSSDEDIKALEHDIMSFLPRGKNSFKYMHRKAQTLILDYLNKNGYYDSDGAMLTKEALVQKEEYRTWSKFMVLRLIFFDQSNQPDDIYDVKSKYYRELEESARQRVQLPIDTDGDGEVESQENIRFDSIEVRMR
jgi:hypothetical protein